jgi:UDP-4-amino-4,6-dideoxy-N-acetyl-beta-L-altrosamine transaminase
MKIIPYGRQEITEEDIEAVARTLRSDYLTQGPAVGDFEKHFAEVVKAPFALAVANGTAALHLAALALGLKKGDKVLCTANSFVASANCILYAGADVEFVDIDPQHFCVSLPAIEAKLKAHPKGTFKGLVAVDFAGYPAVTREMKDLCDRHGLWILEDSCHALGAHRGPSVVGSCEFSDISIFSFHPVKHIATGEGGMITTSSPELYKKLSLLRTHGITKDPAQMSQVDGPWYYEMQELGFNYRMPDILCSLGLSQMKRLGSNLQRRQKIAETYQRELPQQVFWTPVEKDVYHSYHLFTVQTDRRKELFMHLREKGIHAQVHYIPIHTQPYYVARYGKGDFPVAENYYAKALSLPMFHGLKEDEQGYVIDTVKAFFKRTP